MFKVVAYTSDRDYRRKVNGIVLTDLDSLLNLVNNRTYWDASKGEEVNPEERFDYTVNETFEGLENVVHWEIVKKPENTDIRIIGVSAWYSLTRRSGVCVYDSIEDEWIGAVPKSHLNLYPYTLEEFITRLADPPTSKNQRGEVEVHTIPYKEYDFVAIRKH